MSELRPDVAVVGAGPAGSAAAAALARAGRRVLVVDRARFPRDKCCGDGLTTAALRQLEALGLDPGGLPSWQPVAEVWVRSPGGRQVRFPFPTEGTFGAVVRRADLDAALLDGARAAGAEVVEGVACTGASQGPAGVRLELADGRSVRAAYAVAADGMWSPVRHHLGLAVPGYRGEWHAVRQYLEGCGPGAERLHVWFEPDLLPGYAWSFPLPGGRANVGLGILRGGTYAVGDLGQLWAEVLRRPHVRSALGPGARPEGPPRAWPIPARVDRLACAAGRTLFVGDAAAATDPLTGEGIGQALATGRWAAEAVVAAGPGHPGEARRRYEARVRAELVPDHHLSTVLAHALRRRWGAEAALAVAGLNGWTRANFARWLFEDEPRAALATPGRWHRRFLRRDGAYRGADAAAAARRAA